MLTDIRPVNETAAPQTLGQDKERAERERHPKGDQVLFNKKLSSDEVDELIGELNDVMKIMNTKLAFSVDTATNRPVIQVINKDSGDLIRQIPPEEMLRVSQRIHDVLGMLFDERG